MWSKVLSTIFFGAWFVIGMAGALGKIERSAWAWAFFMLLFAIAFVCLVNGLADDKTPKRQVSRRQR